MLKIALLNDYARVGLRSADWSMVKSQGHEITVFDRHLTEEEAATELASFDVLCTIRERMALPRTLIERLPNLKLITIIGKSLPNLDMDAATEHGIVVSTSDLSRQMSPEMKGVMYATPELAWGLLIATVRHMTYEDRRMPRTDGWHVSSVLGKRLGGRLLHQTVDDARILSRLDEKGIHRRPPLEHTCRMGMQHTSIGTPQDAPSLNALDAGKRLIVLSDVLEVRPHLERVIEDGDLRKADELILQVLDTVRTNVLEQTG